MKDATEIVVLMDKSGSMGSMVNDAIGGFNTLINEQKALPGEAHLTTILFDTEYMNLGRIPLKEVEPMDKTVYVPGGSTALLDAMGKSINELGTLLSSIQENKRPDKVIFVIITDGEENSSHEFSKEKISEMVKHQNEKYAWQFIYLGANVDAFAEAGKIGIQAQFAVNYAANSIGTASAYDGISHAIRGYRQEGARGLVNSDWKKNIKQ